MPVLVAAVRAGGCVLRAGGVAVACGLRGAAAGCRGGSRLGSLLVGGLHSESQLRGRGGLRF